MGSFRPHSYQLTFGLARYLRDESAGCLSFQYNISTSFCSLGACCSVAHTAKSLAIAAHVLLPVDSHLRQYVALFELLVTCGSRPRSLRS